MFVIILLRQFDPVSLTIIFQGLAHLHYDDRHVMHELAQLASHPWNLTRISPRGVATILISLCRMKQRNMPLIRAMVSRALTNDLLPEFNDLELCNVLFSLGQLGFKDDKCWKLLVEEASRAERLRMYTRVGLSNMLHGLATGSFNDLELLDALARESAKESRLESYSMTVSASMFSSVFIFWQLLCFITVSDTQRSDFTALKILGLRGIPVFKA